MLGLTTTLFLALSSAEEKVLRTRLPLYKRLQAPNGREQKREIGERRKRKLIKEENVDFYRWRLILNYGKHSSMFLSTECFSALYNIDIEENTTFIKMTDKKLL